MTAATNGNKMKRYTKQQAKDYALKFGDVPSVGLLMQIITDLKAMTTVDAAYSVLSLASFLTDFSEKDLRVALLRDSVKDDSSASLKSDPTYQYSRPELVFVNGAPAPCGCTVRVSDGGGQYSDAVTVSLCLRHAHSRVKGSPKQ